MVLIFYHKCAHYFNFRCGTLKDDEDCKAGADGGYDDDEDGSFLWLKEMGVQDKIKKPDSITIQLYPILTLVKERCLHVILPVDAP